MTATDFRRVASRAGMLRMHVELQALGERDARQARALLRIAKALSDAEQEATREADAAPLSEFAP